MEHQNPFSYAEFLRIFEHDDWFLIDETVFYLDYAPDEEYYLGCLREYEEPYWAEVLRYFGGRLFSYSFGTVECKNFHGRSVKERWENVRFFRLAGFPWKHGWNCMKKICRKWNGNRESKNCTGNFAVELRVSFQ
ncbi:MAG: hypothetical protein ACLR1R_01245 [Ruminococcus callidus]